MATKGTYFFFMVGQKFVLGLKQLRENKNVDKNEGKKTRLST